MIDLLAGLYNLPIRKNLPVPYFERDGITLYHGDCRQILPSLPKVDLVLTDPPYGTWFTGGNVSGHWGRRAELEWDKQPFGDIDSVVEKGTEAVIWGGNYYVLPPSRGWLVWFKRDSVPSAADVELAWTSRDMNSRLIDQTIAATNAERVGHPTQKPLAVMRWCLSLFPDAKTICDPFAGSGTTLRAAMDLGRQAIGIEIDERYCEIAAKRLAQRNLQFSE